MSESNSTYNTDLDQPITRADALVLQRKLDLILNKFDQIMQKDDKAYYTVKEFADKTGIPESSVRYYCNTLEIEAQKRGRSWQIPSNQLHKFNKSTI